MAVTLSTANNILSLDLIPGKVFDFFSGNQKVASSLSQLGEIYRIILVALLVLIDGSLWTHKANIGIAGDNGGHSLIGTKSSFQSEVNTFLFKIPFFNGNVLRGIENGMGNFIQGYLC